MSASRGDASPAAAARPLRARRLVPELLLGIAMVWVLASAVSRGQGFVFFAAGSTAVAALVVLARRRRAWLLSVYSLLAMCTVMTLAFETLLHVAPGILGGYVANLAYTGYHWQGGGIYELDEHAGPILRPSVQRSTYWNGHWWRHETNADGYRGPAVPQADAVFLGDSMIYGHGVQGDGTVAACFGRLTGRPVANLGQQGTSLIQALLILQRRGLRLRPRIVFVCAHPSDLDDVRRDYGDAELTRFLSLAVSDAHLPQVVPAYRPLPAWDPRRVWSERLALRMRCSAIPGALMRALRDPAVKGSAVSLRDPFVPTSEELTRELPALAADATPEARLPWQALQHAVVEMKRLSDGVGARVVLFDLGYPRGFSRAVEQLAAEASVAYSPAGRVAVERSLAGEVVYLASDGHWNARGAEVVAAELARAAAPGAPPVR